MKDRSAENLNLNNGPATQDVEQKDRCRDARDDSRDGKEAGCSKQEELRAYQKNRLASSRLSISRAKSP